MVIVKKLPDNRWKEFRDLRLEALKTDPIAFGSSYEEEVGLPKEAWIKRIKNVIFAFSNDKPIGMATYVFKSKAKTRHIANIFGVYVRQEFRGMGVGEKLVESAISSIRKNRSIIKINLNVNPEQKAAVKLYERYGFKAVGLLKKDLHVNGKFYDELMMEKMV